MWTHKAAMVAADNPPGEETYNAWSTFTPPACTVCECYEHPVLFRLQVARFNWSLLVWNPSLPFLVLFRSWLFKSSSGMPSIPYISISMLCRPGTEFGTLSTLSLCTCGCNRRTRQLTNSAIQYKEWFANQMPEVIILTWPILLTM